MWAARQVRAFATTAAGQRVCETFTKQFRLPGRTTGALSTGVEPHPNDPMVPRGRYFKPKGLERGSPALMLLLRGGGGGSGGGAVHRVRTAGFQLAASAWDAGEHPRDHNGLRIRDYRVGIIASKKACSKRAHVRWRVTRLLRTAAALVLPDKGLRRCDYLFQAYAPLEKMDRDELFLAVERALVDAGRMARDAQRRRSPDKSRFDQLRDRASSTRHQEQSQPGDVQTATAKILDVDWGARRPIHCLSDIVEELHGRD
ncbi:hypothetical protein H4R18_002748 [Coemansia javaensis]|uniref:Uncharacterized protein n=1 Tax=Coemansia javaensis TaxID=2761396 RepID=A0A9W8HFT6_9FUNG|nr:hypothetical protein H4R18_002748 [Coemansia javaensis]